MAHLVKQCTVLGCDLKSMHHGSPLAELLIQPQHRRYMKFLYTLLEDHAHVISSCSHGHVRTNKAIDPTPAETIFQELITNYPQFTCAAELIQALGEDLAAYLIGKADIMTTFLAHENNSNQLYQIYSTFEPVSLKIDFLASLLLDYSSNFLRGQTVRILEVGAGLGGTCRRIIDLFKRHNTPFEYTFMDVSPFFLKSAKSNFGTAKNMSYAIIDIEKPPHENYRGAVHFVCAHCCVHATRNVKQSLSNLREMLCENRILVLIELTKTSYWIDFIMGLFSGWWAYSDGRTHALVDKYHWGKHIREVGLKQILWDKEGKQNVIEFRVLAGIKSSDT